MKKGYIETLDALRNSGLFSMHTDTKYYLDGFQHIRVVVYYSFKKSRVTSFWQRQVNDTPYWKDITLEEVMSMVDKETVKKICFCFGDIPE